MIKVHVFHTGIVRVDRSIPYHENKPLPYTLLFRSEKKKLDLPVSCYLIEHPKGRILIDSGWDTRLSQNNKGRFLGLENRASYPIINEGEGIDTHLSNLELTINDIDAVYLSHLDVDHASGLRLVKDVKHIYASKEEIEDSNKNHLRYNSHHWENIKIEPFEFEDSNYGPVKRSYDVFKDDKVILVSTPGHSNGHNSVLIKGKDKYLILAGDVVYTQISIKGKFLPGIMVDKDKARQSVEWIYQCYKDSNCLGIFPNHDPETNEQVVEIE